ncbi:MAG: RluA family pseudouridine synthase [Treponema sp.]|nr:RluA family pseudouridine synthase [Treponema sp.]MCL2236772.1 RluA family pseudouridine synthase [Treponema sp.]
MELITGENDKGRRLDRILRKALPDCPLPLIHRLLRQKKVLVDGKPHKANDRIDEGITISIPSLNAADQGFKIKERGLEAVDRFVKPEILWEGMGLVAVNKPAGVAVHGDNSLDTIVRSYLIDKLTPSLSFAPGPLHRLDKPSSGIVVFSSGLEGARLFTSLMREQKIKKTYLAVIEGKLEKEEIWQDELLRDKEMKKTFVANKIRNTPHKNKTKTAITKVTPLSFNGECTLIKAQIATGRTHQIRAQAASHGYPLLGDVKYGAKKTGNKEYKIRNKENVEFFLHAWKLEFLDVKIEAPLPQTRMPIASLIASTSVFLSGSLPEIPGISTSNG